MLKFDNFSGFQNVISDSSLPASLIWRIACENWCDSALRPSLEIFIIFSIEHCNLSDCLTFKPRFYSENLRREYS